MTSMLDIYEYREALKRILCSNNNRSYYASYNKHGAHHFTLHWIQQEVVNVVHVNASYSMSKELFLKTCEDFFIVNKIYIQHTLQDAENFDNGNILPLPHLATHLIEYFKNVEIIDTENPAQFRLVYSGKNLSSALDKNQDVALRLHRNTNLLGNPNARASSSFDAGCFDLQNSHKVAKYLSPLGAKIFLSICGVIRTMAARVTTTDIVQNSFELIGFIDDILAILTSANFLIQHKGGRYKKAAVQSLREYRRIFNEDYIIQSESFLWSVEYEVTSRNKSFSAGFLHNVTHGRYYPPGTFRYWPGSTPLAVNFLSLGLRKDPLDLVKIRLR